jgi:hypothetical protein
MKIVHIVAAASLSAALSVQAAEVVAPAGFANALGNGQSTRPLRNYGTGGSRYQQVYNSGLFGAFGAQESVTSIAFRAKQKPLLTFVGTSVTVSNIQIRLSTTAKTDAQGLDVTFANNVGANVQLVYSGPLTLTTSAATAGTSAFDYLITLQNAFTFAKGAGNLLLDITIPDSAVVSGNGSIVFAQFDTVTDTFPSADGISSAFGSTGSGAIGSNSTTGLVTRFTSTPVPSAGGGALFAMACLGAARRRRA